MTKVLYFRLDDDDDLLPVSKASSGIRIASRSNSPPSSVLESVVHPGSGLKRSAGQIADQIITCIEEEMPTMEIPSFIKGQLADLRRNFQRASHKLASLEEGTSKLEQEIQDAMKYKQKKQECLSCLVSELRQLGCEMQKKDALITEEKKTVASKQSRIEELEAYANRYAQALKSCMVKNGQLKKQLEASQKSLSEKEQVNQRLTTEIKIEQAQARVMISKQADLERLENAEALTAALQQKLANEKSRAHSSELHIQELEQSVEMKTRRIAELDRARFIARLSDEQRSDMKPGTTHNIAVCCLRWDQANIHSNLIFTGNHPHDQHSMFKLLEDFMRGRQTPTGLTGQRPLKVFLKADPQGVWNVYSRDNRRLAVFLMYQALNRDEEIWVCCEVCEKSRKNNGPTTGLSVRPHGDQNAVAKHCGHKLFVDGILGERADLSVRPHGDEGSTAKHRGNKIGKVSRWRSSSEMEVTKTGVLAIPGCTPEGSQPPKQELASSLAWR